MPITVTGHAGEQAVAALRQAGVDVMFTLNAGHVWPLYEAARSQGMQVVDTRHEQCDDRPGGRLPPVVEPRLVLG